MPCEVACLDLDFVLEFEFRHKNLKKRVSKDLKFKSRNYDD